MQTDSSQLFDDLGDLGGVSTKFPVLPAGLYTLLVQSAEVLDNKEKTGKNLILKLATTAQATSTDGEAINPGWAITHYVGLRATENYDPRKNLAKIMDSVYGNHTGKFVPEDLVGKEAMVKLKVETSDEYGTSNKVAAFVKKG